MKEFEVKFLVTEQDIKSLVAIKNQVLLAKDHCFLSVGELIHLTTIVDCFEAYLNKDKENERS